MKSRGDGVEKNIDKSIYDDSNDGLLRYRGGILIVASIIICFVATSYIITDVSDHFRLNEMSIVAPDTSDTIFAMDAMGEDTPITNLTNLAKIIPHERIGVPPKDESLSNTLDRKATGAKLPTGNLTSIADVEANLANDAAPLSARKLFILGLPFDINTATAQDLAMISGIGENISGWIIDYRKIHGPFLEVGDLKNVKGIGEYRAALIGRHVKFGNDGGKAQFQRK